VNTLTLILIVWHLKMRFFSYRESVEMANEELSNASETLDAQTRQLHEQQVELNAIRNNLEDIVSVKTREVLKKSDVLKEYAFVNAHHVRGPLARILGLIHLIELEEGSHPQSGTLDKIKQEAEKMDAIIQRINEITS
jgi:signal transduction histidine kinase